MKYVEALIDYDNSKRNAESSARDVNLNLSLLTKSLSERIHSLIRDSEELTFRLYGGWIALDRQTTHQANWLLGELSKFRGRTDPLRTKLSLATTVICRNDLVFVGTYREGNQKMVDGMIYTDLIHLARDESRSLVLVSDDDDFVPSLIASSALRSDRHPIFVFRKQKKLRQGPNDHILQSANVNVVEY